MYKMFFFFLGFFITVVGLTYIICYLNLLTLGFSFAEYIKFILTRFECLMTLVGFLILTIIVFTKGDMLYDLYL